MKLTKSALKRLIKESIENNKILRERPWSVEYSFMLSGGTATDSEGEGPDGFAIVMSSDSGREMRVVVDTYWNPQSGDTSGNSIRVEMDGQIIENGETYVPVRMDDGEEQFLTISNSPVADVITISHAHDKKSPPVVYLVVPNPFEVDNDVSFDIENIGNGKSIVKLVRHINL